MAVQKNVNSSSKVTSHGNGLFGFFREIKAELNRITWAKKVDVKKATMTVITFCLLYVVYIGVLDGLFSSIVKFMFK